LVIGRKLAAEHPQAATALIMFIFPFSIVPRPLHRLPALNRFSFDEDLREKEANIMVSEETYPSLTPREMEVMQGLARGRLYKEIADELGMSYSAVHKHQHRIFRKLRVGNRTEAVIHWTAAGTDH
jgi:DNA-binding NarL/FixJ family response regulator